MKDLPLNALRCFATVYESGGVRPAGRELGVSHSSVSRHLKELEDWLGVPVLHPRRGRHGLAFTPQGEALGRVTLECLASIETAVAALREQRGRNAILLSTTPSFAARWLLPRLPRFRRSYPWIELSVVAEQRLVAPGDAGADLAVRMGKGPWPDLECEALMDDALFPVMSRRAWEDAGRPSEPEQLKNLTLVHDRDVQAAWALWISRFGPTNFDATGGPRFDSSDLVLRAAVQGLGVALARGRLVAEELDAEFLVRPFGDRVVPLPRAYWIVRPRGETHKLALPPVLSWLKEEAALSSTAGD